jgi:hypothetical protein
MQRILRSKTIAQLVKPSHLLLQNPKVRHRINNRPTEFRERPYFSFTATNLCSAAIFCVRRDAGRHRIANSFDPTAPPLTLLNSRKTFSSRRVKNIRTHKVSSYQNIHNPHRPTAAPNHIQHILDFNLSLCVEYCVYFPGVKFW